MMSINGCQKPEMIETKAEVDAYLLECKECVEFDQAMVVAKNDGHGQVNDVTRILAKESNKFYNLGESKHEDDFGGQNHSAGVRVPILGPPPA